MTLKTEYIEYQLNQMQVEELKQLARESLTQEYVKYTDYDFVNLITSRHGSQFIQSLS